MFIRRALLAVATTMRVASAFVPATPGAHLPALLQPYTHSSRCRPLHVEPGDLERLAEAVALELLEPLLADAVRSGLIPSTIVYAVEDFGYRRTAEAADRLARSTVSLKPGLANAAHFVQRGCVADFNSTVQAAVAANENFAILVYGPLGGGKSCMVLAALQGTQGAVHAHFWENTTDVMAWLDLVVARGLPHPTKTHTERQNSMHGARARAALAAHRVKYGRCPVIIIEANSAVTPQTLCKALLAAKQLGFEESLATFVVVASAVRTALGTPIGLRELRVRGYSAPEFTAAEAHEYIQRRLPHFPGIAPTIVGLVGERAIDLVDVCRKCRGAASAAECVARARSHGEVCVGREGMILRNFLAIANENAAFSKDGCAHFLRQLVAGTPALRRRDACDSFGFKTTGALFAALAEWQAFAVDPFDGGTVSMPSNFMRIAMEHHLAKEEQRPAVSERASGSAE